VRKIRLFELKAKCPANAAEVAGMGKDVTALDAVADGHWPKRILGYRMFPRNPQDGLRCCRQLRLAATASWCDCSRTADVGSNRDFVIIVAIVSRSDRLPS
jgi:hypothetical protein